jgi:hypothetical protein
MPEPPPGFPRHPIVLVLLAYAVPLWDLLHLTRYGSPGDKPF